MRLILALGMVLLAACSSTPTATTTPTPDPSSNVVITETATAAATPAPATSTEETETEVVVERPDEPRDLVAEFLQALAEGDEQTSFGLLTVGGQEAVGGLEGWSARFPEYAEGLGAYWRAEDFVSREIGLVDANTTVVEVLATVEREGQREFDVAALTVRPTEDDELGLDLFPDFREIVFERPPTSAPISPQPEFAVTVFDDVLVELILDGEPVDAQVTGNQGKLVTYTPPTPLTPGRHTLTAVVYAPDAADDPTVDAATTPYTVEG